MMTSAAKQAGAGAPPAGPGRTRPGGLLAFAAFLAAALAACPGCVMPTHLSTYVLDRTNDAGDMVDIGISFSKKPCFSAYACGLGLFTVGAGYFDGYFAGLGGGGFGVKRHYLRAIGLLAYSYEESAWGAFDLEDPGTIKRKQVGLLSQLLIPAEERGGGPS
jgi:hypothetical protein